MAEIETPHGTLRRVKLTRLDGSAEHVWRLRCPGCGEWGELDDDQLHGRVSVDHAAQGCSGGYHETHDFAAHLPDEGGGE